MKWFWILVAAAIVGLIIGYLYGGKRSALAGAAVAFAIVGRILLGLLGIFIVVKIALWIFK